MHKKVEKLKIMIWDIFADGTKVKIPFEKRPHLYCKYMQGGMYDTIKIGFDILLRTSSP